MSARSIRQLSNLHTIVDELELALACVALHADEVPPDTLNAIERRICHAVIRFNGARGDMESLDASVGIVGSERWFQYAELLSYRIREAIPLVGMETEVPYRWNFAGRQPRTVLRERLRDAERFAVDSAEAHAYQRRRDRLFEVSRD